MVKRLQSAVWFLVDYGPLLLTIGFTAYVIALAQTRAVPTDTLLQWVLAALALLASASLIERARTIRRIAQVTDDTHRMMQSQMGERPSADEFFFKRMPSLEPYLANAKEIQLFGPFLQRTIRENVHLLAQRLESGASVVVVVMKPDGVAAQSLSARNEYLSPDRIRANYSMTEQNLRWLATGARRNGKLSCRILDEEPYADIIGIDVNEHSGVILVELFAQRRVVAERPRFELRPDRDKFWYEYYRQQCEVLMAIGEELVLTEKA